MDHIGIDVHRKDSQICILGAEGERSEQRVRTTPDRFADVFGDRPRARILLEEFLSTRPPLATRVRNGRKLAGLWSPRPIGAGSPRFSGVAPAMPHTNDSENLGIYSTGAILA
jgi:hypothetical protein